MPEVNSSPAAAIPYHASPPSLPPALTPAAPRPHMVQQALQQVGRQEHDNICGHAICVGKSTLSDWRDGVKRGARAGHARAGHEVEGMSTSGTHGSTQRYAAVRNRGSTVSCCGAVALTIGRRGRAAKPPAGADRCSRTRAATGGQTVWDAYALQPPPTVRGAQAPTVHQLDDGRDDEGAAHDLAHGAPYAALGVAHKVVHIQHSA